MSETRECINDFSRLELEKTNDRRRRSDSNGSVSSLKSSRSDSSEMSQSEIAGQRLYDQALKTKKKIEQKREKAAVHNPQLDLATRGRNSRDSSPIGAPRYMQLYENARSRRSFDVEEKVVKAPVAKSSEGCDRLYALSNEKQQEGKKRREEIIKSKIKAPPPYTKLKKISAEEAAKIYDRGMQHLLNLEMKRIEAAVKAETPYDSPLLRTGSKSEAE